MFNWKAALVRDYDVTSAGISAEEERQHRMRVYFIMMSIRMVSVMSLIWLRGWWVLLAVFGGVVLPYLAVVIANQPKYTALASPEQPEPLSLTGTDEPAPEGSTRLIVVDEPADRRTPNAASVIPDDLPVVDPVYLSDEEASE